MIRYCVCHRPVLSRQILWLLPLFVLCGAPTAFGQFLRVVSYNIDADTGGADGEAGGVYSGPGLTTVLQAIGNAKLAGHAQPIDVLALQELNYSRTTETLGFIVDYLNSIYDDTYAYDTTLDPTTGDFTGNGPNGLVYNTTTVQVLGATPVGSASGSGAPRAPMRYKLAPFGYNDHSADFWLYESHMKSGSYNSGNPTNGARRDAEAKSLRDDAALLGSAAHIIYSGDFNFFNESSEAAYQTLISASYQGGVGKAIDSVNPAGDWTASASFQGLLTESADLVQFRDDFQFVTGPMLTSTANTPGMKLVDGSYIAFGNGGGIYQQSVTHSANSAALIDLGQPPYSAAYRSSVLTALTTTTDHLPVVADYSFATAVGIPGDYDHSGVVNVADYNVWRTAFGSTSNLAADGNKNGVVDAADYAVWRDHMGSASGAGAVAATYAAVPEPSAAVLTVLGVCWLAIRPGTLRGWTRRN